MGSRAAYMREWRQKRQNRADPLSHGTQATYSNYGCRCADCREAHNHAELANRRAKQRLADAHRDEFLRYLADEQRKLRIN